MIEIIKAPPFASVQDLGWATGRSIGLPQSGAMDPALLSAANAAVGNPAGTAAIEWALGSGMLRFEQETLVSVLGDALVRIDGKEASTGAIVADASTGLEVTPAGPGRFVYVAVRGGIDVPEVLGSRSTYLPGGFGGFEGRRLKNGDLLPVGHAPKQRVRPAPASAAPSGGTVELRVTRGPQWDHFDDLARSRFFAAQFTVSAASDRMGYRLEGIRVTPREPATLPSEAACPGAVQIPDGGSPIVLMPDGPTVGGYPKLVIVVRADLPRLAQCRPGREVRFREVTLEQARALSTA